MSSNHQSDALGQFITFTTAICTIPSSQNERTHILNGCELYESISLVA